MPTVMDVLLLATGITGAWTLSWLGRLLFSRVRPSPSVTPHFGLDDGGAELLAREIAGARREVIVQAVALASRAVAQALVDARLRGVAVELLLDASNEQDENSELHFLVDQGLPPWVDEQYDLGMDQVVLVDGVTVLAGGATLVVTRGYPDACRAYREQFQAHKAHSRAVPAKTSTPPAQEDALTEVAASLASEPEPEEPTEENTAPVVTPAAAELFARLRQELGETKKAG